MKNVLSLIIVGVVFVVSVILAIVSINEWERIEGCTPEKGETEFNCWECTADDGKPWATTTFLGTSFVLIVLTGVAVVGSGVQGMVMKPTGLKGMLISVGSLLVICGICYGISSGQVYDFSGQITTASTARLVDAGLKMFYALLGIAVLSIIFSGVWKAVK